MSSYLTPIDYLLWILFTVIEVVLFFRLTARWLKPLKYFMLYAAIRDIVLLILTPKELLYQYFIVCWVGNIISFIWCAFIARTILKQLVPRTPAILTWLHIVVVLALCVYGVYTLTHLNIKSNVKLLNLKIHCQLISTGIITSAVIFSKMKQFLSVAGLIGTGAFTAWAWNHLGYQPLVSEMLWIVGLIGVGLALKQPEPLLLPLEQKL